MAGWAKGQSGNAKGRKPGTRCKATVLAERLMADDAAAVVASVVAAAIGGDMAAAKLVLDRIAPLRRGRPVAIALPPIATAADVAMAAGLVTAAMSAGTLSPEEAVTIGAVIEANRAAVETATLADRLAALEERFGDHIPA